MQYHSLSREDLLRLVKDHFGVEAVDRFQIKVRMSPDEDEIVLNEIPQITIGVCDEKDSSGAV